MLAGKAPHATRPVMAKAAVTNRVHGLCCIDTRSKALAFVVIVSSPHDGSTVAGVLYTLIHHVLFMPRFVKLSLESSNSCGKVQKLTNELDYLCSQSNDNNQR